MARPSDYLWIEKWGLHTGSGPSYIRERQQLAAQEKAPLNATHRNADGTWSTTDDILRPDTRLRLGLPADPEGTVGRQVEISVVVAYRIRDFVLPEADPAAPEYIRAMVVEAVEEKLAQGCVSGARIVSVMPGREKELVKAEESASARKLP